MLEQSTDKITLSILIFYNILLQPANAIVHLVSSVHNYYGVV
jgi:hypothetical protein